MKTYSKEQQKQLAVNMFTDYPKVNKVHVTSDGQCFADENEHAAKNHAAKNRYNKELSIETFMRDQLTENGENGKKTSENNIKDIESAKAFLTGDGNISELPYNTLKDVVKWLEIPVENQQKETLIAALETKRTELKTEQS